jgi:molybdopterin-guanine dinucleotide biosynthesis protein B
MEGKIMKRIHIVGGKNHGKTALIVELVRELSRRGLRVGTIKHSSHDHELDICGADSHRHRQAGGAPAAAVTPGLTAVYLSRGQDDDLYRTIAPLYVDCDMVIVEGHLEGDGTKIEVWRDELGTPSLSLKRGDILAVVTDSPLDSAIPVWPRKDIVGLADRIITLN